MKRTYAHVMCDLETLGTAPGATLLSIGLVPFDVRGVAEPADRLHLILSRGDSERLGFYEDPATLGWWGQQSWEAQETLRQATEGGLLVKDALRKVNEWLLSVNVLDSRGYPQTCIWGNGSDFDNVLMATAFAKAELALPWPFWHNRCFRTLKSMHSWVREPVRQGTHHNALDDAVHQAKWATMILRSLEPEGEG